jgi:hypothetical protein
MVAAQRSAILFRSRGLREKQHIALPLVISFAMIVSAVFS